MELFTEVSSFHHSGEKINEGGVFVCTECQAKRTIGPGKRLPVCSCKKYGYWYQLLQNEDYQMVAKKLKIEKMVGELTEDRKEELTEYFFDHMWHDHFGEAKINKLSLYYNKQYIPSQIEELKNNDRNEDFLRVLYEINSKYPFDDFWFNRDEIEENYPEYNDDIMDFFNKIEEKYSEDIDDVCYATLDDFVNPILEREAESIKEQARKKYAEMFEGGEAD